MMTMLTTASPTAARLMVSIADHRTGIFSSSSPGSASCRVRPSKSLIWLEKMMTAMPAVKPTVTGNGMNLM